MRGLQEELRKRLRTRWAKVGMIGYCCPGGHTHRGRAGWSRWTAVLQYLQPRLKKQEAGELSSAATRADSALPFLSRTSQVTIAPWWSCFNPAILAYSLEFVVLFQNICPCTLLNSCRFDGLFGLKRLSA